MSPLWDESLTWRNAQKRPLNWDFTLSVFVEVLQCFLVSRGQTADKNRMTPSDGRRGLWPSQHPPVTHRPGTLTAMRVEEPSWDGPYFGEFGVLVELIAVYRQGSRIFLES